MLFILGIFNTIAAIINFLCYIYLSHNPLNGVIALWCLIVGIWCLHLSRN